MSHILEADVMLIRVIGATGVYIGLLFSTIFVLGGWATFRRTKLHRRPSKSLRWSGVSTSVLLGGSLLCQK